MILADYFKRVEAVDEANADAQVQKWKDMLDRFGFEYVSVEYVDGKVVVEYCTTNITGILSMGVIPDIEQEKTCARRMAPSVRLLNKKIRSKNLRCHISYGYRWI